MTKFLPLVIPCICPPRPLSWEKVGFLPTQAPMETVFYTKTLLFFKGILVNTICSTSFYANEEAEVQRGAELAPGHIVGHYRPGAGAQNLLSSSQGAICCQTLMVPPKG